MASKLFHSQHVNIWLTSKIKELQDRIIPGKAQKFYIGEFEKILSSITGIPPPKKPVFMISKHFDPAELNHEQKQVNKPLLKVIDYITIQSLLKKSGRSKSKKHVKFDASAIKGEGHELRKYANIKKEEYNEGKWLKKLDQMFEVS